MVWGKHEYYEPELDGKKISPNPNEIKLFQRLVKKFSFVIVT